MDNIILDPHINIHSTFCNQKYDGHKIAECRMQNTCKIKTNAYDVKCNSWLGYQRDFYSFICIVLCANIV